jgi:chromosome partitioning protein
VPIPRTEATVEAFAAGQPVVLRTPEDPASVAYFALAEALQRRNE